MNSTLPQKAKAIGLLGFTTAPIVVDYFVLRSGRSLIDDTSVTYADIDAYFSHIDQWTDGLLIWFVALLIFYLVYLYKTEHVPAKERPFWAAALILGNIVAMPIFWYRYMWQTIEPSQTIPD
ncbi:MAG: hypothetical protein H6657_26285 [Ardenticatenaceae bacterium]|nr:hypothetical protein [Ardenticatenaceae bacterium]